MKKRNANLNRRNFIQASALAGTALAFPSLIHAKSKPLKVGTYGGYFQESFDKHIFPEFTKETGIQIESISIPTSEAWLVQLQTAAKAKQAPADVSMMAQVVRLKGQKAGLWAPLDEKKIPNYSNLPEHFIHRYADGQIAGVGAVSWYITLVTNTDKYSQAPESWKELWDPKNKNKLGLMALLSSSFLLEMTAKTWFNGTQVLDTQDGIEKVMKKLAEVKSNVRLWYRDEGQFQQALEVGEIPMGQYYHDVTGLAAAEGKPVRSTFPVEVGILDSGDWVVSKASKKLEKSQVFINYMSQPSIQAKLSRFVGTAPTVDRKLTDLTDEEYSAVASSIDPIIPRYDMHGERADWISQQWSKVLG